MAGALELEVRDAAGRPVYGITFFTLRVHRFLIDLLIKILD